MAGTTALAKAAAPMIKMTRSGLKFFMKNSNLILTVVSATGVLATVAVAIHGTIKAVKLCEEKQVVGTKEVLKTVWKCYIPTIGAVVLTTTAILCNGRINAKKLAVLTSAYSGTVEALKKVEEKMGEQIGPKKTQKAITDAEKEIAQENVPPNKNAIIATGKGTQLFFCATTGQWFYSDRNGVELAEMKLKKHFADVMTNWGSGEWIPVSEAQDALNLPETDMGGYMGWFTDDFLDSKNTVEFVISSDWMDLPWGKEIVGIVRMTPWPSNI